jgi:hypothetical protein
MQTQEIIFVLGLLVGTAFAIWRRCPLLTRSACVLAANWVACECAKAGTGVYDPTLWFIVIDAVSAAVLLLHPAGRTQAAIGAVYVLQLGMHAAQYPGGVAVTGYLSVLTVGGSLQIAFLILGAIDGDGRRKARSSPYRGGDHDGALADGGTGLEKGARQ